MSLNRDCIDTLPSKLKRFDWICAFWRHRIDEMLIKRRFLRFHSFQYFKKHSFSKMDLLSRWFRAQSMATECLISGGISPICMLSRDRVRISALCWRGWSPTEWATIRWWATSIGVATDAMSLRYPISATIGVCGDSGRRGRRSGIRAARNAVEESRGERGDVFQCAMERLRWWIVTGWTRRSCHVTPKCANRIPTSLRRLNTRRHIGVRIKSDWSWLHFDSFVCIRCGRILILLPVFKEIVIYDAYFYSPWCCPSAVELHISTLIWSKHHLNVVLDYLVCNYPSN